MNPSDMRILRTMRKFGGDFAKRLAEAAFFADDDNFHRIKTGWPDYWAKYEDMADTEDKRCPKCNEVTGEKRFVAATFRLPDTEFYECSICNHQWGHQ